MVRMNDPLPFPRFGSGAYKIDNIVSGCYFIGELHQRSDNDHLPFWPQFLIAV